MLPRLGAGCFLRRYKLFCTKSCVRHKCCSVLGNSVQFQRVSHVCQFGLLPYKCSKAPYSLPFTSAILPILLSGLKNKTMQSFAVSGQIFLAAAIYGALALWDGLAAAYRSAAPFDGITIWTLPSLLTAAQSSALLLEQAANNTETKHKDNLFIFTPPF